MVDKLINENVKRKDLELILEVNKKAIEIQSEVVGQYEEVIDALEDVKSNQEDIKSNQEDIKNEIEKIAEKSEKTNREIFKIQILFVTGLLSIVIQIIQMFVTKK